MSIDEHGLRVACEAQPTGFPVLAVLLIQWLIVRIGFVDRFVRLGYRKHGSAEVHQIDALRIGYTDVNPTEKAL